MTPVKVTRGSGPLILGQPHGGTYVPHDIAARFNANGRLLADTDWHIEELYDGLLPDVTVVGATFHRYVIDANRDPSGTSLYPGQNTTGLVPLTDFDGAPIWSDPPAASDVALRTVHYHRPYHAALEAEIARVKSLHGIAIVYDCHSIRSRIPFLFRGDLPVLNIGTDDGRTCATRIEQVAHDVANASEFSNILNGRFRGGWTTRHYGHPHIGVHAIQMEISQSAYLETEAAPWRMSQSKANALRPILKTILQTLEQTAKEISLHA